MKEINSGPYRVVGRYGVKAEITPPVLLKQPRPKYTEAVRTARIEGRVVLEAIVRKNGYVDSFKVIRSFGYDLEREYPKPAVKKVIQLKKGWSRGQKAALGAAIGFPAGLGIGYGIGSAAWGRGQEAGSLGFALGVLLGGTFTITGRVDGQTYEEVIIYESVI